MGLGRRAACQTRLKSNKEKKGFEVLVLKCCEDPNMNRVTIMVVCEPEIMFYEKAAHIKTMVKFHYDKTHIGT